MERTTLLFMAAVLVVLLVASAAITAVRFSVFEKQTPSSVATWVQECETSCGHHPVLRFEYDASTGAACTCGK